MPCRGCGLPADMLQMESVSTRPPSFLYSYLYGDKITKYLALVVSSQPELGLYYVKKE